MDKKRRKFLGDSLKTASAVGLGSLVLGLYTSQSRALASQAIRPPGALEENDFLGACVRCGLCVRDCPYDTLKLAELGEPVALGTPYFTARETPCEMCENIPCVVACPTGALDHSLTDINDARMGLGRAGLGKAKIGFCARYFTQSTHINDYLRQQTKKNSQGFARYFSFSANSASWCILFSRKNRCLAYSPHRT